MRGRNVAGQSQALHAKLISNHAGFRGKIKFADFGKGKGEYCKHHKDECSIVTLKNGKLAIRHDPTNKHRIIYQQSTCNKCPK